MRLMRAMVRRLLSAPIWHFDSGAADAVEFQIMAADELSCLFCIALHVWKRSTLGPPWPATALAHWHVVGWLKRLWPVAALEIVQRDVALNGQIMRAGLIGSVRTIDKCRGVGLGRRAIEQASAFIERRMSCSVTILLCEPAMVAYYEACGFTVGARSFTCTSEGKTTSVALTVMLKARPGDAVPVGPIDLCGPPV